ncbi:MAG: twin-arginine translocation pathway signal protein [Acidobacteria bacterium]|nr:MAG: twin-arginine translocation pathway signal protein [Acidobacteriota bacterium]PYY18844.1 MAG: twin-arginine translocation pathway signal protein [Acidobacteriota bacterium]
MVAHFLLERELLLLLRKSFFACFVFLVFISSPSQAAETSPASDVNYRLRLFHTHTGQRLDIVYRRGNTYDPEALAQLNQYLRDHRSGDVRQYDPRVFDLLHDLTVALGRPNSEINVVCGYRTPWSNEYLRTHGHGVAKHSLHMQAMAIDIRVPGVRTSELRDTALSLHRGGVGYYGGSDFVHVDVGRERRW